LTGKPTRRKVLGLAGGAAIGAVGGYFAARRLLTPRTPPNVVLIVSDAFRADRLGARRDGVDLTPNLNRLAAESAVYGHCYAPSSWTKTSMACILTGTYPPYNGVFKPENTIPKSCDTIADMLTRAGYLTYGVQTNPWLAPEDPNQNTGGAPERQFGFHKGFGFYDYIEPGTPDKSVEQPAYADAAAVNNSVERILEKPFRPLFLYVHYMETHQPWMGYVPRQYTGRFCSDRRGRSQGAIFQDDQRLVKKIFSVGRDEITDAEATRLHEIYDEAVLYVDSMIGETLDRLAKAVDLDNTVVIFTADHGDELLDHDGLGHAHTLFEEVTRVPLVIRAPGMHTGKVAGRVSNVNLYETIKAIACPQDTVRDQMGRPLLGPPRGSSSVEDEIIFAQLRAPKPDVDHKLTKLVDRQNLSAILKNDLQGKALSLSRYDLTSDPTEHSPLEVADSEALFAEASRMERGFLAMAAKHGVIETRTGAAWQRSAGGAEERASETEMTEEEKRMREQLKALGYFGN
jgi:arylsulfatase A-like enzyme